MGYGIVGRILKAVTAEARAEGIRVGVLRPITLYPFPKLAFQRACRAGAHVRRGGDEQRPDGRRCSAGANGARPVEFLGRCGGNVPSHEEVLDFVRARAAQIGATHKEQMAYV